MRCFGPALVIAAAAALVSAPASADDRLQSSFTALVGKGFEVKSVTLIPLDVAKRVTEKVRTDNVVVTLQKSEAVAVCYIAFANWAFMNKASLDSPTLCEVRSSQAAESAAAPAAAAEAPAAAPAASPEPAQAAQPAPAAPAAAAPETPPAPAPDQGKTP